MCEHQRHEGATVYQFLQETRLRGWGGVGYEIVSTTRGEMLIKNPCETPFPQGFVLCGEVTIPQSTESISDYEIL